MKDWRLVYTVTLEDLVELHVWMRRKWYTSARFRKMWLRLLFGMPILLGGIYALAALAFSSFDKGWLQGLLSGFVMGLVLVAVANPALLSRRADTANSRAACRKRLNKTPGIEMALRPTQVDVTADGLEITRGQDTVRVRSDEIGDVDQFGSTLLIRIGEKTAEPVPRRAFHDDKAFRQFFDEVVNMRDTAKSRSS